MEIPKDFAKEIAKITDVLKDQTELVKVVETVQKGLEAQDSKFQAFFVEVTGTASPIGIEELGLGLVATALVLMPLLSANRNSRVADEAPYDVGSNSYSVEKAAQFYNDRPLLVFSRLMQLAFLTSSFNVKLLLDWRLGNLEKNQKERAKEALVLSTQLGPTFIKLGQALSIRTDLIPEAYALELRQLQDAVPPFDSAEAKEIMKAEFKVEDLRKVFSTISEKPIASASIGQVYRCLSCHCRT